MSWRFGGFIVTGADPKVVTAALLDEGHSESDPITLSDATKTGFVETAVGSVSGATLVINHSLPHDCAHGTTGSSPLDEKLARLSSGGRALSFFLDGQSGSYGFTNYLDGVKTRSKLILPREPTLAVGEPLELERAAESHDEEELILALIESLLDASFARLIFDDSSRLTVYEEELEPEP